MSPRLLTILRAVATIMLLWFAYRMLERIHGILVLVAIAISATNVVILWMTRFHPEAATPFGGSRLAQRYVNLICRIGKVQQPCHVTAPVDTDHWLCKTDQDYLQAAQTLRQSIRGHDQVIGELVGAILNAVKLRSRRRNKPGAVIASFLLAGPEGIGKTFLARQLARQLYSHAECLILDCTRESNASLFGSPGADGHLLTAIRQQPCQLVCLQHIDLAAPDVQIAIRMIVSSGAYRSPHQKSAEISFENTIIYLTTTAGPDNRDEADDSVYSNQQMQEFLEQESQIDADLLHSLSLTLPMAIPSPQAKSEVVAQRLVDETAEHGLALRYVDPLLIASEVARITADSGFSHVRTNIKKLLSKPLLEASSNRSNTISLYVRSFTP